MEIKITVESINLKAKLNNTNTAKEIYKALPIKSSVNRWGDEIYFEIPLKLKAENAKEIVDLGDLGYWPPGKAFCIFFGKTPVSKENEIRPYSPVNVFGKVIGNVEILKKVKDGAEIRIEKA